MILTNENLKNLQIWKSIFIGYELKIYLILKKKILMFVGISDFLKKLGISNYFFWYQLAGIPEMYSWLKID